MVYLGILFWRRSPARESLGILLPILEQCPGSNADPKAFRGARWLRKANCRFCPFPDIFIQPRTQVYKGRYEEYCLALFFEEVTVSSPLAGQAHYGQ